MKKKNHQRKETVHPSPAPATISNRLSFLPATILTLTVALSPEDTEVLAYLISCCSSNGNSRRKKNGVAVDHQPMFRCRCFHCYMSYWIRWNSSPNRHLIHEIIDAFEDCERQDKNGTNDKSVKGSGISNYDVGEGSDGVKNEEKWSVRRFLSYIIERIWKKQNVALL